MVSAFDTTPRIDNRNIKSEQSQLLRLADKGDAYLESHPKLNTLARGVGRAAAVGSILGSVVGVGAYVHHEVGPREEVAVTETTLDLANHDMTYDDVRDVVLHNTQALAEAHNVPIENISGVSAETRELRADEDYPANGTDVEFILEKKPIGDSYVVDVRKASDTDPASLDVLNQ